MAYESIPVYKISRVAGAAPTAYVAGPENSLWEYDGCPSGGVPPTTWAIPDNTTAGGIQQTNPSGGGVQKWLTNVIGNAGIGGTLTLYDRILHVGGFSGTTTTAQNVNGGSIAAPTRYTDGKGNRIFLEIYAAVGNTQRTATVVYTDENGSSASATGTMGGAVSAQGRKLAQQVCRMTNPTGNPGVKDVTSVTLSASTGNGGNFGLVIAHEISVFQIGVTGTPILQSFLDANKEILSNACLAWTFAPTAVLATGSIVLAAHLHCVDK